MSDAERDRQKAQIRSRWQGHYLAVEDGYPILEHILKAVQTRTSTDEFPLDKEPVNLRNEDDNPQVTFSEAERGKLYTFYREHQSGFTSPRRPQSEQEFVSCIEDTLMRNSRMFYGNKSVIDAGLLRRRFEQVVRSIDALIAEAHHVFPIINENMFLESLRTNKDVKGIDAERCFEVTRHVAEVTLENEWYKFQDQGQHAYYGSCELIFSCYWCYAYQLNPVPPPGDLRRLVALMHDLVLPDLVVKDYRKRIEAALPPGHVVFEEFWQTFFKNPDPI